MVVQTITPREREILSLTAQGRSAPDIALLLELSAATVRTHLLTIYEKLGVTDRSSAVAAAGRHGLLE